MYLFRQVIPAFKTIQILSQLDLYAVFHAKYHQNKDVTALFPGYKFAIVCCLDSFLEGFSNDSVLGFKNDLFLNRAIAELVSLDKLNNTCDKIVLLKNIKPYYKQIARAENFEDLNTNVLKFIDLFLPIVEDILNYNTAFSIKRELKPFDPEKLLLIDFAHTYLVQINNNGPAACGFHPINPVWNKKERLALCFEGYKYAIQFLWYNLMGADTFEKSSLTHMHEADSWRKYKFVESEGASTSPIFGKREFNLAEQTSFDSYFYRIKDEFTERISGQIGFFVYTTHSYYKFLPENYDRNKLFEVLLNKTKLTEPFDSLTWNDKVENTLYYYSFKKIDGDKSPAHQGIASFNIQLAGSVSLHKKKNSEFSKIIVAKFKHPWKDDLSKNEYSFGILIDTMSSAGHYSSGWLIYENVCGDYSGFSGSEFRSAEKLIEKYQVSNKIELRELTIPLSEFKEFTSKYDNPDQFSTIEQDKQLPDIVQKSRAHLFELFVYYLHSKYHTSKYTFLLNTDRKTAEKDLVLENESEVILIECKLNPQNHDLRAEIAKMEERLALYKQPTKSMQLWFWYSLSPQNREIVDKKNIKTVIVSQDKTEPLLKGIALKQLRYIMQT